MTSSEDNNLDFPSTNLPDFGITPENIQGLPLELRGDPRRQAVPSIHGTVYQAWCSIDAWLCLTDDREVIYLEGAEDFDIVREDSATTVQVKQHSGSISLGNAKAHEALENYWKLFCSEPSRKIEFHYLTTSRIAREQESDFEGLCGIEIWRAAQTNVELTAKIAEFLSTQLDTNSALRLFLITENPTVIQELLIRRFHWLTDQPDIDVVKRSVDNRIAALLEKRRRSVTLVPNIRKYLESKFWEVILNPDSARRCLTQGELLHQVENAITTYLPVPVEHLPDLIGNADPGLNLLNLLLEKLPKPPALLLLRPTLTKRLEELVKYRKVVMLTGTVYKGKTTVAQLVTYSLCPDAWWINLTGRQPNQDDNIFLALARQIEKGNCPNLIVIDDLNISPAAVRVYKDSLALVMHRARTTGRGVLLTAQGDSSNPNILNDFHNIALLDVPELTIDEIMTLCIQHGCPKELASPWSAIVAAWTRGHPKLVQVRLANLVGRNWPKPESTDLTTQSPPETTVRQVARQLLNESVATPIVTFVYLVSECCVPVHRSIALRLADSIDDLDNAGDVIDFLAGKWFECLEGERFRTTALLNGVAAEVWSPEKRKQAHISLHDAISIKSPLAPAEAAALVYHAFIGNDPRRLATTALKLQIIRGEEAKREVEKNLLWLPFVAIEEGQSITDDAMSAAILRGLQFNVAKTLDADCLAQICERWREDIEKISHPEAKIVNQAMMWLQIGFSENPKIPLKYRLEAIAGIPALPSEVLDAHSDVVTGFFKFARTEDGLPEDGTTAQAIFLCANRAIRNLNSLNELIVWLDNNATDDIRQQFDAILDWPLVQNLGAFVQGAWVSVHEDTQDWESWLTIFERVDNYAKRHTSPRLGREAAKARSIILSEYLSRSEDALTVLDQAEIAFGTSAVLLEQRANIRFHDQEDEAVLDVWYQLNSDPLHSEALDPFSYRRAGISASRLHRWNEAGNIFIAAASSLKPGYLDLTKFGLLVDAAFAIFKGGRRVDAIKILVDAILSLPPQAMAEGDERWEAVQRAAFTVTRTIKNCLWNPTKAEPEFEPGYASSPNLKVTKVEPGQATRIETTKAEILLLFSTVSTEAITFAQELNVLSKSNNFFARWSSSEAKLALFYGMGAGEGFFDAFLDFDKTLTDSISNVQQDHSVERSDDTPNLDLPPTPEQWFGMLCAGIICSGSELHSHLRIWLNTCTQRLGENATLADTIQLFLKGESMPVEILSSLIVDTAVPPPIRCGAAARLLQEKLPAERTFKLQAFLTSALVSDKSYARQEIFNWHVARSFAKPWRGYAQNAKFQFYSPGTTIPPLLDTLDNIESGNGTLKSLLIAASNALNQPHWEFMERLL